MPPEKLLHLEILKDLHFNTPNFYLYGTEPTFEGGRLSLRTELKVQQTLYKKPCPHFPNVEFHRAQKLVQALKDKYHILIQEGIDPENAACSGTCMYDGESYVMEIAWGPGTVRRVTSGKEVIDSHTYKSKVQMLSQLFEVAQCAEKLFPPKVVLEWSQYTLPVGIKKKHVIFWGYDYEGV